MDQRQGRVIFELAELKCPNYREASHQRAGPDRCRFQARRDNSDAVTRPDAKPGRQADAQDNAVFTRFQVRQLSR